MPPETYARPNADADAPIILFDAMCVLCSANARFILRHDRHRLFRLASMQGPVGAALYRPIPKR